MWEFLVLFEWVFVFQNTTDAFNKNLFYHLGH